MCAIETVPNPVYRTYRKRWIGVVVISLLNIIASWGWVTYAPVSSKVVQYFNFNSNTPVNWLSTTVLFSFSAATPLAIFISDKLGIKFGLIIGAAFLLAGNWIRYIGARDSHAQYGLSISGQIFIGVGQTFCLIAPPHYSDLWFPAGFRVISTGVMTLSNILGIAICQVVNPSLASTSSDIPKMILYIAIISSPVCISTLAIGSKPPSPPGPSGEISKLPLGRGLYRLLKNPDFLCILASFAIFVGFFNAFTSLLEQILAPYGWSDNQAGTAGAVLTVTGAVMFSFFLDKSQRFVQSIRIIVPVVSLCFLSFIFVIHFNTSLAVIIFVCGVLGASAFSLLPLALELTVECTHPVSPQLSTGILWVSGQLFGAIFLITMDALRYPADEGNPKGNYLKALIFQGSLSMAVIPLSWCIGRFGQSLNRRLAIDKAES